MAKALNQISAPTVLLCAFVIISQVANGLYLSSEIEPPPIFTFLRVLMFLWIIGWWLQRDSRKYNFNWVLDLGLFLYVAWPIIMPYYLLRTRGLKGFIPILVFSGIYLGAALIGVTFYVFFSS